MVELKRVYSESVIERGEGYLDSVKYCIKIDNIIFGKVEGSDLYKTEVNLDTLEGDCSCPYGSNCKHAVALYLTYKNGEFSDSDGFVNSLKKMSRDELIELILSKLKDNSEWIMRHNIRKKTNHSDFIKSFKKVFSQDKVEKAEALLHDLSFKNLLELNDYIDKNYDSLLDEIYESDDYNNNYEQLQNDDYDAGLLDLSDHLKEIIVKKALEEKRVEEVIKRDTLSDEIINNADLFVLYKDKIKKNFSKKDYLEFLLNLNSSNSSEIKDYVDDDNKTLLYEFIDKKSKLIKSVANLIKDTTLLFSVAVYEKDFDVIIKQFDQFGNAVKEDYEMTGRLSSVVDLFRKNNFKNGEMAKKLLNRHVSARYDKTQLSYLVSQVSDFDFIRKLFDKDHIDKDVVLLERLAQIDKNRTFEFVSNNNLIQRHWSDVVVLFNFLKKSYDNKTIRAFIEKNQEQFRTSSHLKKHLKDEGIFISQKEGKLFVDIK